MVTLYVLVVLFGLGQSQSSFAIDGIASIGECERLSVAIRQQTPVGMSKRVCLPYQAVVR